MASGPNPVTITIGGDAGPLGKAAREAGSHLEEMKKGMGKARETAMFFTQALGEFGPQGRTAQIAISGIAGAMMGGGGLLLALGLAQAAARMFTARLEEQKKAAQEARKELSELAGEAGRLGQSTGRSAVAAAQMVELRKQRQLLEAQLAKAEKDDDEDAIKEIRASLKKLTDDEIQIRMRIEGLKNQEAEASARRRREEAEKLAKETAPLREGPGKARIDLFGPMADQRATYTDKLRTSINGLADAEERWAKASMQSLARTPEQIAAAEAMEDAYSRVAYTLANAGQAMAADFVGAFRPILTNSAAFTRAMRAAGGAAEDSADLSGAAFAAMAQNALANLAIEAGTRAIFETALGISNMVTPGMQAAGAAHFVAAGLFAGIAAGSGVGAYAIGQNRGMTAAERAQVEGQKESQLGSGSGAGSGAGGGGDREVRTTVYVISPWGFTEGETSRAVARTLRSAGRLGYLRGATAEGT